MDRALLFLRRLALPLAAHNPGMHSLLRLLQLFERTTLPTLNELKLLPKPPRMKLTWLPLKLWQFLLAPRKLTRLK
ncbi:hypothetical protein DVH05_008822 [Phytophthora capsici]|nr:hypothetical protein DVH05_008822 [Phytophthora capsici]